MRLISSQLAGFFRNENFQINSCEYGIISKIFAPSKEIKVLQIKNLGIMKKDKKMIAATCSKMVKNEYFSFMVKWGEILNMNLMELMAEMGCHPKALMAEVYALAKLWAYLRGISERKGYQVDELFEKLVPMFEDEVKEILKDEESK